LILALVFVILIAFSILGLVTFGGGGIKDAASLQGQRSLEYAADGATTAAIEAVRYNYLAYNGAPPVGTNAAGVCLPAGASQIAIPEEGIPYNMVVSCSGTLETAPTAQYTRVIVFTACQNTAPCTPTNAIVTATVDFQDLSPTGIYSCYDTSDTSTCGTGMVISSWVVENADT